MQIWNPNFEAHITAPFPYTFLISMLCTQFGVPGLVLCFETQSKFLLNSHALFSLSLSAAGKLYAGHHLHPAPTSLPYSVVPGMVPKAIYVFYPYVDIFKFHFDFGFVHVSIFYIGCGFHLVLHVFSDWRLEMNEVKPPFHCRNRPPPEISRVLVRSDYDAEPTRPPFSQIFLLRNLKCYSHHHCHSISHYNRNKKKLWF